LFIFFKASFTALPIKGFAIVTSGALIIHPFPSLNLIASIDGVCRLPNKLSSQAFGDNKVTAIKVQKIN
jgi:hypothetical protein